MDDLEINHVERPRLPWRTASLTECGLVIAGHPVITRAEFIEKVSRLGKQRAAMTTCMTCFHTAGRRPTWEENPVGAMNRESQTWKLKGQLENELRALAELVERHRDEFDSILSGLADAVSLDERRRERQRRRA